MTRTAFVWTARMEGASLLLLFLVAMPLKYVWGEPEAVRWVGLAHGLLFLTYVALLATLATEAKWSWSRVAYGLVASVLPAGTFVFERSLRAAPPPAQAASQDHGVTR